MKNSNFVAAGLAVMLSIPAMGQVFVRTVLDEKVPTAQDEANRFNVKLSTANNSIAATNHAEALKTLAPLALASIEDDLEALVKQNLTQKEYNDMALEICKKNDWALKNRRFPVRWKSARSVCFWLQ